MKLTKDYYFFQIGIFILLIGSRCSQLAIAWWALEKTGSPGLFAKLIAVAGFAEIAAKPLFGWLGDQLSRRNILLICNIASAMSACCFFILAFCNYFNVFLVGMLLIIFSVATGIRDPIHSSILPMLVKPEQLTDAFRFKSIAYSISLLLGPGFAGLIISLCGITQSLAVDFIAILFACLMIMQIKANTKNVNEKPDSYLKEWCTKTYEGFKAVVQVKTEFYLALLAMMINFALYPFFMVLLPVFVKDHLAISLGFVGVMDSFFGLGILVGSALLVKRFNKLFGRNISVFLGFVFLGIALLATGIINVPLVILPFMIIGGTGLMLININTSVLRSLATPQSYRNRMSALVSFVSASISPFGTFVAGFLTERIGVVTTIQIFGISICCISLLIFIIPQFSQVMKMSEEEMQDVYVKLYPKAF